MVEALPTVAGLEVNAPCLRDSYLVLECRLNRLVRNLGRNVLIVGEVVAARVHPEILTDHERDAQQQIHEHPLLAYVSPGRFCSIEETRSFPFPRGFSR